jgi:hypothetical protein
MPLSKFIDCDVDGDLSALVIEGDPTEEEILTAWLSVKTQYADITGNQEYTMYKYACRDVNVLQISLVEVETLVSIMRKVYSPMVADRLNKILRSRFKFNHEEPEEYINDLEGCITRTGSIKIQIDLKRAVMNAMEGKQGKGEKPTREYYHRILISLSDHAGYDLTDKISVFDFCERVKRFNKFCEQQKNAKNVGRVNR